MSGSRFGGYKDKIVTELAMHFPVLGLVAVLNA